MIEEKKELEPGMVFCVFDKYRNTYLDYVKNDIKSPIMFIKTEDGIEIDQSCKGDISELEDNLLIDIDNQIRYSFIPRALMEKNKDTIFIRMATNNKYLDGKIYIMVAKDVNNVEGILCYRKEGELIPMTVVKNGDRLSVKCLNNDLDNKLYSSICSTALKKESIELVRYKDYDEVQKTVRNLDIKSYSVLVSIL